MRRPALLVGLLLLAACGADTQVRAVQQSAIGAQTGSTPAGGSTPASDAGAIEWSGADGVQTGTLSVPYDYDDPSKGSFELFLARHEATGERIGSLLVNPGGPGYGGSDYAIYAEQVYGPQLLEHFDIVGWDPRGTGRSAPAIDCFEDYDHFFAEGDITPDNEAEHQELIDTTIEATDACLQRNAEIIPYVGTNNSARDIDAIRRALGEEQISYFGFSYGSELGATWATLFPDTVRAAVLDGAADPTADFITRGVQQVAGFEGTLTSFLAQCSADDECEFHNDGDAEGAFDALMEELDEHPIPANSRRPDLTRGAARQGVARAMYDQAFWPDLEQSLADAQDGGGAGLQNLYDAYYGRMPDGSYGNELEAFNAISCMDVTDRPTVEEADATVEEFQAAAPRFAPSTVGSYFCTFWPDPADPRVEITGDGAGPILVMGTTGDPATPLSSTEAMADVLEDGRLVVVTADQHTGYSVDDCSGEVVDNYLVDPRRNAPPDGYRCD